MKLPAYESLRSPLLNMDRYEALVQMCIYTMGVWDRQGNCYKLVTWILLQFQH